MGSTQSSLSALSLAWALLAGLSFPALTQGYDAVVCGENGYSASSNTSLSYSANAWNPDGSGFQCMSIDNDPPAFDATWSWTTNPGSVHSYPHVSFSSQQLPVALFNISSLVFSAQWSYSPGQDATSSARVLDAGGLDDLGTVANIAFDMFADPDPEKSLSATTAAAEIMIWVGSIGQPWPIGYSTNRTCFTQTLGSVDFTLYIGQNARNTTVFTWLAKTNETGFFQEISPLLQYLWRNDLIQSNATLGLIEFGSEAYHADGNVTFSASNFSIDISVGEAPQLDLAKMPKKCSSATGAYVGVSSRWLHVVSCSAIFYVLWL